MDEKDMIQNVIIICDKKQNQKTKMLVKVCKKLC